MVPEYLQNIMPTSQCMLQDTFKLIFFSKVDFIFIKL